MSHIPVWERGHACLYVNILCEALDPKSPEMAWFYCRYCKLLVLFDSVTAQCVWLIQLRTQEIGNSNNVLRMSFCAKRLDNKVCCLKFEFYEFLWDLLLLRWVEDWRILAAYLSWHSQIIPLHLHIFSQNETKVRCVNQEVAPASVCCCQRLQSAAISSLIVCDTHALPPLQLLPLIPGMDCLSTSSQFPRTCAVVVEWLISDTVIIHFIHSFIYLITVFFKIFKTYLTNKQCTS